MTEWREGRLKKKAELIVNSNKVQNAMLPCENKLTKSAMLLRVCPLIDVN